MMEDREKTMSQPQTGQDDSFWWTVEFSLGGKETGGVATEEDTPWNEERLWTVATMSGAIGSELVEKDGSYYLDMNVYDFLDDFTCRMIHTDVLGKAFEPEQKFENPDGTPICFDKDYFGSHRGMQVIPGPFASKTDAKNKLV